MRRWYTSQEWLHNSSYKPGDITIAVYIASEADAERADMRSGFALELASKDARIAELENIKTLARRYVETTKDESLAWEGTRLDALAKALGL